MGDVSVSLLMTLGLGVIGGAALGKAGFDHMFVHGMTDKERKTLVGVGLGSVAVFGAAYALGIDEEWLSVDGIAGKISNQISVPK